MSAGGVVGTFKEVLCMIPYNGDLIVAGRFDFAGSTQSTNIARWDGSPVVSHGRWVELHVRSLYVIHSAKSCMQESFTHSGSTQLNYIAKWDGNAWQPLGSGLNGAVYGISYRAPSPGCALSPHQIIVCSGPGASFSYSK
ncbi:MAG: hypothetical protein IPI23_10135 [Bacteroidetes bacterium]|nr:hypothetical protein [Bacteroidota bacterium]